MPPPGAWMIVWLITVLVAIVGQIALTRLALANRSTVGDAISHAARRTPVYFAGQLIWLIPFAIGLLLVMPGVQHKSGPASLAFLIGFCFFVYISIRMLLTAVVASQEAVGPVALLQRSWNLTAGSWLRLFGFFVLFVIGAGILMLATLTVVGLLVKAISGDLEPFSLGALLVSLATQIVLAAVYVVLMAMVARLYAQAAGGEPAVPSTGT